VIGLLRAEVRRMFSRRLFRLLGGLAVLALLVSAAVVFARSSNDPQSGLAAAQREVANCEHMRAQQLQQGGPKDIQCPTIDEMRGAFDRRFNYAHTIPEATRNVALPLFFVGFIVGASFVGAEWGSGVMTTLLTWEPRRGRVLASKTIAAVAIVAVAIALFLALLAVVYLPVGALRGTTAGMTGAVWRTVTGIWLRAAGLAAFGTVLGAGLATLTRNTAGSVGIGFVFGAIIDPLLAQVWHGRFRFWGFQHNFPRLLGLPVEVPEPVQNAGPGVTMSSQMTLSITRPIVLLTIYGIGLFMLAWAVFRARDVT
jgi:ABC-2 type transport system permease protein